MRGYFGIGMEGVSKSGNAGNVLRTTHAFGGSFFFTVGAAVNMYDLRHVDTSDAFDHVPYHAYETPADLILPKGCRLIGIELTPDAVELPSFRHPTRAAYVLGPEMGSLSSAMQERCDFVVKIPMKFCVNVGVAGALVM